MFSAVPSLTSYLGFSSGKPSKTTKTCTSLRRRETSDRRVARRDREFWVNDGNIVLIARDLGFRIYPGLLATQSTIFADTFDSPNSSADEYYDDCPVVRLSGSPEDLRYSLRVLVRCSHRLFYQDNVELSFTFDEISAVIRPSHKYHTFNEDGLFLGPSDAIAAVNLSRLTDTTSILPLAFNICAIPGLGRVHGSVPADGSVERLSAEDLRLCLEMKARLAAENAHVAFLLRPAAQHCSNALGHMYCAELWRKILEHAGLSQAPHPVASECPLDHWLENADCLPAPMPPGLGGGAFSMYMSSYPPPHALCKG